ncbi:hypothetical protein Golomagni_05844 [Golovinomyces magnicellulatus]|nr:hypothetical protein Golomagni_05844 [Golovinomyces magnicellulatus]
MSRPQLFTRGLSGLSQSTEVNSPAEQRDEAKLNFLKAMRTLDTQHVWNVYLDQQSTDKTGAGNGQEYKVQLQKLQTEIKTIEDFWRYNNNTPVHNIKMRDSLYLFKEGYMPIWEDRRNIKGGSWTFRVPKSAGPDVWTRVQLLAVGEQLESVLDEGVFTNDQLCGVGLSVRFNSHLITIWHRDSSKQKSIDAILACVLEGLPEELKPRQDNYYYKKHSEHAGFKAPGGIPKLPGHDNGIESTGVPTAGNPLVSVQPPS